MTSLPPVWVISLPRATDRREYVIDAFARVGISASVLDAVDGESLTESQRSTYSHHHALFAVGRDLSVGEVAVVHSHLTAYRRMLEQGLPALVVAEDDADPSIGLARLLTAIDELPDDWDVVTFHSMFGWSDPQPIDDKTFAGEYRICTYRRVNEGAQCYLISARAASRMLEVAFPVRLPIDELLFRSRPAGLKVYGIEPNPVGEHGFPSELRKRRTPVTETRHAGLRILDGAIVVAGKVDFRVRRRVDQVRTTRPRA